MAPAEGRADAATHDGSTIAGSGAVGAVLGDADAADVSDLAALDDSARLRRASSQDVGCSLPGAITKAIPKRYATERTLATVRTTSPERKPSSPSKLARQSSFGPSTPPTHHLKQQLSVLRAEVSAHRLTHQGLRKVLNEATDLPRDSHAPAMDIIRRANSLLDYAESMIDENKGDAGASAPGTRLRTGARPYRRTLASSCRSTITWAARASRTGRSFTRCRWRRLRTSRRSGERTLSTRGDRPLPSGARSS